MRRIGRLLEDCNANGLRHDLLEQFEPLHGQFRGHDGEPGYVAARARQTCDQAAFQRSPAAPMTIGMLCVARCAARIAAVPPTTMISTFARSRSPISEGIESTSSP